MAHWNHRIIEHRDSTNRDHEIYYTVHEIYYADDGGVQGWSSSEASPRSREEARQIIDAFDHDPVAWVDDSTHSKDEFGFDEFGKWGWMPNVKVAAADSEGW